MSPNSLISGSSQIIFDDNLVELIKEKNNVKLCSIINSDPITFCTAVDISGASLLHYAAEHGNEIITICLITSGSNVNLRDQHGRTPLILATRARHKSVAKILLGSRAFMHIRDNDGRSALHIAIHANLSHASITKLFIKQVIRECSPSMLKAAKRLTEVNCPLYKVALLKNRSQLLSFMVQEGSAIDAKDPVFGMTALHIAVDNVDAKAVECLIAAGADVNSQDNSKQTPIAMFTDFASRPAMKLKIAKWLIDKGAVLTTCTDVGVMQMYWILRYGDRDAVRMIVESNVDISKRDDYQQTGLHYLARNIRPGIVDEMKDVKIDVDRRDKNGMTALHIAMAAGNAEFVEYLISKDADVNAKTNGGFTPIFQAFGSMSPSGPEEQVKCVNLLLEHGAVPELEIEYYFSIYETKSAVHRDFALLKLLIKQLVQREAQGKLNASENIFRRIESYSNLKDYVDVCRKKLMKETISQTATASEVPNKNGKKRGKNRQKKKHKKQKNKKKK